MRKYLFPLLASVMVLLTACSHNAGYSGIAAGSSPSWTTVVYMAADNDLEADAICDFNEMISEAECLAGTGHTVLVLMDRAQGYDVSSGDWTDTRLFRICPESDTPGADDAAFIQLECSELGLTAGTQTELDMASPKTLERVLRFAQDRFPADYYALVMWGHGCGWRGYAVDEESRSVMPLPHLHEAVASLDQPLSVIAFDCCYGAMLETAYELRNEAAVLVATERDEPAAGWNYAYLLQNLSQMSPLSSEPPSEQYARCIVNAFGQQYADSRAVSITAVKLSEIGNVFSSFDSFSRACADCLVTRNSSLSFASGILSGPSSFLSGEYPAYRFIDVKGMADSFLERGLLSCNPSLTAVAVSAAEELCQSLGKATLLSFTGGSGFTEGISETPMLAVYLATVRSGGVVDAEYPQMYVRGSGISGQCSFVRDSAGWVPQQDLAQSTSLLDHLYRMPLP